MNIAKTQSSKIDRKHVIIYISIILFCVISIVIASYVQFYARVDIAQLIGIKEKQSELGNKSQDETETLKANFDNLFNNSIQNDNGNDNKKVNKEQGLICTKYSEQRSKDNSYEININIPYINIDSEIVDKYNQEIENVFVSKARNVLKSENKNIIFTVEYVANVQDDILSLMIKSNLKEGSNPQRIIIQTYNYDLRNNKEISLEEVLKIEQVDKQEVQNKIKQEIDSEEKKVKDLKQLGYNIYDRDISSDIYNVENTTEFYLTGSELYLIYAYGNDSQTSEKDIVIL